MPSFFYVLYVPSFFTCLRAIFLRVSIFLHAYILFTYMLIHLTQISELTYNSSSLLLFNLPSVFTITFTEEKTWLFKRLEYFLEREIQGIFCNKA